MPCQTARPDGPCRNLAGATGPCASGTAAARRTAAAPRQHDRTCPAYRSRNTAPSKPGRRQTDTPTPTPRRRRQPATACGDRTRPASIAIVEKFLNSSCRHSFDQATPGGSSRAALRRLDIEAAANPQTCPIRLRSGAGSESTPSPIAGPSRTSSSAVSTALHRATPAASSRAVWRLRLARFLAQADWRLRGPVRHCRMHARHAARRETADTSSPDDSTQRRTGAEPPPMPRRSMPRLLAQTRRTDPDSGTNPSRTYTRLS